MTPPTTLLRNGTIYDANSSPPTTAAIAIAAPPPATIHSPSPSQPPLHSPHQRLNNQIKSSKLPDCRKNFSVGGGNMAICDIRQVKWVSTRHG